MLFIIKKKENGLKCTITLETDDMELPLGRRTFKDTGKCWEEKNKNMDETNLFYFLMYRKKMRQIHISLTIISG